MIIKSIAIRNFRSVKESDVSLELFNIQVGQNNHGKTNYFESIRWFFNGYATKESKLDIITKGQNTDVSVQVTFTGLQDAIDGMTNTAKQTALRNIFTGGEDEITIRRDTTINEGKKRQLQKPDGTWHDPMGVDKTWGDLLPKLEYVDTQTRASEINGYTKKSPITEMLSGILGAIIEGDPNYQEFTQKFRELFGNEDSQIRVEMDKLGEKIKVYLQKQFPDGNGVTFDIDSPVFEDLLKNFSTKIDDGVITNIEEKGDGMQRALMLSIIQAYADYRRENAISRRFIFLVDEAELHLHPRAQRALKRALREITDRGGEQVLINTHSSVLISDDDATALFKVVKNGGVTEILPVDILDKPYVVYDLLGGSPLDLLLPRNYLIVEGASECKFLQVVIERFYKEEFADIFVLAAEGDISREGRSMAAINHVFLPIKPIYSGRTVILCDKPNTGKQADFDEFVRSYKLNQGEDYFVITEESLEGYYPGEWKKTESEVKELQEKRQKVAYAAGVASAITQEVFENEMPEVYGALLKARDRAFG